MRIPSLLNSSIFPTSSIKAKSIFFGANEEHIADSMPFKLTENKFKIDVSIYVRLKIILNFNLYILQRWDHGNFLSNSLRRLFSLFLHRQC